MALHRLQLFVFTLATPYEDIILVLGANVLKPGEVGKFILVWRYLGHGVHHTGKLVGPDMVQLALWGHVHPQGICFQEIESHEGGVLVVYRVIDSLHITYRLGQLYLSVVEIGFHLLGRYLIVMCAVGKQFHRQSLPYDMSQSYGGIVHIGMDYLSQELAVAIPHDRILVHRHAGVLRVVHKRVAHPLYVSTVGTYLVEGMHLTVHRVSIDIEGIDLHRVGVHPQRVFLRIVHCDRVTRGKAVARLLVIAEIIATERILALLVYVDDISVPLAVPFLHIVETVTGNGLVLVGKGGTSVELCLFGTRIVISVLGINHTAAGGNLEGPTMCALEVGTS